MLSSYDLYFKGIQPSQSTASQQVVETVVVPPPANPKGWLGVNLQVVTPDMASAMGMSEPTGALINGLTAGGPAAKAGIQVGDVTIAVNGQKIAAPIDLARKIAEIDAGSTVEIRVLRQGAERILRVTLGQPNSAR